MFKFVTGLFGGLTLIIGGLVAVLYSMSGEFNVWIPGVLAIICGVVLYEWGTSERRNDGRGS